MKKKCTRCLGLILPEDNGICPCEEPTARDLDIRALRHFGEEDVYPLGQPATWSNRKNG